MSEAMPGVLGNVGLFDGLFDGLFEAPAVGQLRGTFRTFRAGPG